MCDDFEVVTSTRGDIFETEEQPMTRVKLDKSEREVLVHAVADNFDKIIDVASSIVEIEKINAQADACVKVLEEKRKLLAQEADNYVKKVNADTNSTVSKVEMIRFMMQDYYRSGQHNLSGSEFSRVITEMINQMGEI